MGDNMFNKYEIKVYTKCNHEIRNYIKNDHYSGSCPHNTKYYFGLYLDNNLVGGAVCGIPAGRNCQTYSFDGKGEILELRRLVLNEELPKNSESYFISKILKYFEKETNYEAMLSYADPTFEHTGIIYKASNFDYLGRQKQGSYYLKYRNKIEHYRTVKSNPIKHKDLLRALSKGWIKRKRYEPKHIYLYRFKRFKFTCYDVENNKFYINYKKHKNNDIILDKFN